MDTEKASKEELINALESTTIALDSLLNPDADVNASFNIEGIARNTLKLSNELLNRIHGKPGGRG